MLDRSTELPRRAIRELSRLTETVARATSLEEVYDASLDALAVLLGVQRSAILLFDPDGVIRFKAHRELSPGYRRSVEGHSPWGSDDKDPDPVLVSDAARDESLAHLRQAFVEESIGALAFFPMSSPDRLLGKFMLYYERPHEMTELEVELAEAVARHVGIAVTRIREESTVATQLLITRTLAEAADLDEGIRVVLTTIVDLFGWNFGAIWRVQADGEHLRCVEALSRPSGIVPRFEASTRSLALSRGEGFPGRIWDESRPLWREDALSSGNFPRRPAALQDGIRTGFGFPIIVSGRTVAVMELFARDRLAPDRALMQVAEAAGHQIGQILERRGAEESSRADLALRSALYDAALDSVLTMDADGRLVDMNAVAERMFGYARSAALGQPLVDLIVPVSLRAAHRAGLARYLETGEARVLGRRVELLAMRADGSEFPIELTVTRVDVPGPPKFVAFVRDIVVRRRHEESLEFLAEASKELGRSLDPEATINAISELAVPVLADLSAAYLAETTGAIRRLSVHTGHTQHADAARAIEGSPDLNEAAAVGVPKVVRSGMPEFHEEVDVAMLAADASDPSEQTRLLRVIEPRSWMCIPVRARGRVIGAVSFLATGDSPSFARSDLGVATQLVERAELALENALLYQERDDIARTLQQRLLPPDLPSIPGITLAARYVPAGETTFVGGDFYDVFPAGGDAWELLVGDVCGKGPEAAAHSALIRHTVRAAAITEPEPSEVLRLTNDVLLEQGGDIDFATACLVRFRLRKGVLRLVSCAAGHPLPLKVSGPGEVREVGAPGLPLGAFGGITLADSVAELGPGELVFLYTDGVTEHRRGTELFGDDRLRDALAACAAARPHDVLDAVERAMRAFSPTAPRDDVAMLCLRVES